MDGNSLAPASIRVSRVRMTYLAPTSDAPRSQTGAPRRASWRRLFGLPARTPVQALKGVSFTAYQGDKIGLMGPNGSGKSTLLRIIAGVEPPTSGTVEATSTPTLLGINAALVPQLSGRRNIELGLYAMGFDPPAVRKLTPRIAEFSGIGQAVSRPMNTYSAGMGARLRFAIAAVSRPDILLIDEALGAGDAAFAQRSDAAIAALRERAGTIVLVSHAAETVERTCTRALWLQDGELLADGPARETARKYRWWAWNAAQGNHDIADDLLAQAREEFAAVVNWQAQATDAAVGRG